MALARVLVAAGASDMPWSVPNRLRGRSLHRLAQLTIEGDSLRFRRYRENARFLPGRVAQEGEEHSDSSAVGAM